MVVVLGPLRERMVVTVGALDACTHEHAADELRMLPSIAGGSSEVGGALNMAIARCGQQLPNDVIVRSTIFERLTYPVAVCTRRLRFLG